MVGNLPPCRAQPLTRVRGCAVRAFLSAGRLTHGGIPFLNVPNLANPHHQDRNDTCESLGISDFVISVTGISCDLLLCRPFWPEPLILLSAVIGGRLVYTTAGLGYRIFPSTHSGNNRQLYDGYQTLTDRHF
jgi:hypothetical protein